MSAADIIATRVTAVHGTDDREARSKVWVAFSTRPRSEKKAASEISKFCGDQVEVYIPLQTTTKQWSDRKKRIEDVVIPMILFVKLDLDLVPMIERHPLISKCLRYPNHKEPIIPSNQIERLKFMIGESDVPIEFGPASYKLNDTVKVIRGSLTGLIGQVEIANDDTTKIVVSIDLLGRAKVVIRSCDVEPYQ